MDSPVGLTNSVVVEMVGKEYSSHQQPAGPEIFLSSILERAN